MRKWPDLLKDLLRPDDHGDPYVWAAVFLAHGFIGVAGWVFLGLGVIPAYIVILAAQAMFERKADLADTGFDVLAVAGGALVGRSIDSGVAGDTYGSLAMLSFVGALGVTIKLKRNR